MELVSKGNLTIHDFKRVCRTCLSTVDLQPIASVYSEYLPVEIALNKYTQIQFDPLDDLPKQICSKCVKKLNSSYNFLLNCESVTTTLKECLARHEHNSHSSDCLQNELEYVNCEIKKECENFEDEINECDELRIEKVQTVIDIKEEAPDPVKDFEDESDNYGSYVERIITNVKNDIRETPEAQMQIDMKRRWRDATMIEMGESASNNVYPEKSRERYEVVYRRFMEWKLTNNIDSFSETVLLKYFDELSKTLKPSTLWAIYSMLKTTISIHHDSINIANYSKLLMLLRENSRGFKSKKSKILNTQQIYNFLQNAPDSKYLFMKVVLIIGITGSCRKQELRDIKLEHISDTGKSLIIRIPESTLSRTFVVSGLFYPPCKKYMNLRPQGEDTNSLPFFLHYRKEKCTKQCVGKNNFGGVPQKVAEYLKLPDANQYTGHCFRQTFIIQNRRNKNESK